MTDRQINFRIDEKLGDALDAFCTIHKIKQGVLMERLVLRHIKKYDAVLAKGFDKK